ncbi:DUF4245 domain-containing protein [Leucobacter viscericola]|uniref:DUF4245 domain-containing protein n=1 Tax=Leucobacter viscericola TaxID=2714935 RepID=A0A6G7XED2_9MICO|nr:DUF4245 family protein [Leucobacter viscericola]QIK62809.1 DUF4245 domain-containing protein [Leucobacter viscericola]
MAKKQKPPTIVAELGRPETKAETAARKATDSFNYRQRKTVNNLVFSLIVTLGVVLVIFLAVPQGKGHFEDQALDVKTLAAEASPTAGRTLVAPEVPKAWKAKQARLLQSDDVNYWKITYTTVDEATGQEAYASVVQAFTSDGSPVDDAWVSEQFERQEPTGSEQLAGIDWVVFDHPELSPDNSNVVFALQGTWKGDAILVSGTDTPATLRLLAIDAIKSLESGSADATTEPTKEAS